MIIDPREVIKLTRELLTALKENTDELRAFNRTLASLEVKQDALDLEIRSLVPPEVKG